MNLTLTELVVPLVCPSGHRTASRFHSWLYFLAWTSVWCVPPLLNIADHTPFSSCANWAVLPPCLPFAAPIAILVFGGYNAAILIVSQFSPVIELLGRNTDVIPLVARFSFTAPLSHCAMNRRTPQAAANRGPNPRATYAFTSVPTRTAVTMVERPRQTHQMLP